MGVSDDIERINKSTKPKKGSVVSSSSSCSFLELPWSHNEVQLLENARYLDKYRTSIERVTKPGVVDVVPETKAVPQESVHEATHVDPLFYPYTFVIPLKLKRFIDNPPFEFTFASTNCVKIMEKGDLKMKIEVFDFKELVGALDISTRVAMCINRKQMHQKHVAEENRNYRNAVNHHLDYERGLNRYEEAMQKILGYQVRHRVNILHIGGREDLLRELKCVVRSFGARTEYVPKVKTFDNSPSEFMRYIIAMIPGISKNVACRIGEVFLTMKAVFEFLSKDASHVLKDAEVWNNDKTQKRRLGDRQYALIKRFLLGDACDVCQQPSDVGALFAAHEDKGRLVQNNGLGQQTVLLDPTPESNAYPAQGNPGNS